ncbi:hypothetical protein BC830DRAFT_1168828 [Chytriomyces sp. MP71]|nr:hypothetical protein BC830DRAFT_1168828 [Chytriomyces sp. MP71]
MKALIIVCLALVFSITEATATFTTVVSFGDSISDNGNLYASFGKPKSPYWKGRYSNGPVWSEYLASFLTQSKALSQSFELKGFANLATLSLSSYASLANTTCVLKSFATSITSTISKPGSTAFHDFAYAGALANILDAEVEYQKPIPDIASQYSNFTNSSLSLDYASTLFTVYVGINDIWYPPEVGAVPNTTYIVGNISTLISNLTSLGAKHIMVNNIFPIESSPTVNGNSTLQALYTYYVTDSSAGYNAILKAKIESWKVSHPSVTFTYNDFHGFGSHVMSAAGLTMFSFKTVADECYKGSGTSFCGAPTDHFFWDYLHPTTKMHLLFAGYAYYNLMVLSNWAAASL